MDEHALRELFQSSPRIAVNMLPASPAQAASTQSPLIMHICRIWLDAGLSDRDWQNALRIYDNELANQPRQHTKAQGGGEVMDDQECRWTLETFSMFVLKFGVKLRDCQVWFEAFDLDKDEMVGVADFLQGLVATSAPSVADPHNPRGLCTALVLSRLMDMQRHPLDAERLQGLFAEAQAEAPRDLDTLALQVSTDLEAFRAVMLPLQELSQFRLPVFG